MMKDDPKRPEIQLAENAGLLIRNPQFAIRNPLCGLRNLAALNAGGADFHSSRAALWQSHANRLQVRITLARRAGVCVRYIITELRRLATDFTAFSHYFLITSRYLQ